MINLDLEYKTLSWPHNIKYFLKKWLKYQVGQKEKKKEIKEGDDVEVGKKMGLVYCLLGCNGREGQRLK